MNIHCVIWFCLLTLIINASIHKDHLTLLRHSCGLAPGVMVDQHEAVGDTTGLTYTGYLVHPTGIRTANPWNSKQQPCILPIVPLVL